MSKGKSITIETRRFTVPSCNTSKVHGLKLAWISLHIYQNYTSTKITHLPKSPNGNDSIVVVVDKLTKYVHCFAVKVKISSRETAELFFERIATVHGLPSIIISDRYTRFTSRELMRIVGVQQNMSTSFHPQTDGQSERNESNDRRYVEMLYSTSK